MDDANALVHSHTHSHPHVSLALRAHSHLVFGGFVLQGRVLTSVSDCMQGRGEIRILDSTNDSTVRAIAALLRCLTRATYCMQQGGDGGEPTAYPTTSGVSCLPLRRLLPTPPASPALRRLLPSSVSCPLASLALRRLLPSAVPSYPTHRPHRLPAAPHWRACDRCFSASPDGRLL